MKTRHALATAVSFCGLSLISISGLAQGSLTPPGAPSATMLTLTQIEPRTPVDATHTGSGGAAEYLIVQPGSYYLTGNIAGVATLHGINISANNVTLDLNGFTMQGVPIAGDGIYIHAGYTNITIRNGTITGWGSAGDYNGIELYANNVVLEHLNISSNNYCGILASGTCVVRDCICQYNNQPGIYATEDCDVRDCNCSYSEYNGIYLYLSGRVSGCTCDNNGEAGINCAAFGTVAITACVANNNHLDGIDGGTGSVTACVADGNGGAGIAMDPGGLVSGCVVEDNGSEGLDVVGSGSTIVGNTCIGNSKGILVFSDNNRIEDNHVTTSSGHIGIEVIAGYTNNIIVKNSVIGDGANNYSVSAGNDLGPVGTAAASTSPWANISH